MKNIELLNNHAIVGSIPLVYEGRELPSKLQAKLMLMRVSYDKAVAAFNEKVREALNGLKPEGFDDLARDIERMRAIEAKDNACKQWNGEGEKPSEPTQDEIEEAANIRAEKLTEYELKEKDLLEKLAEIRRQEMEEECSVNLKLFTEDEYASIIETIKTEGVIDYKINGQTFNIGRVQFLELIASNLVG